MSPLLARLNVERFLGVGRLKHDKCNILEDSVHFFILISPFGRYKAGMGKKV